MRLYSSGNPYGRPIVTSDMHGRVYEGDNESARSIANFDSHGRVYEGSSTYGRPIANFDIEGRIYEGNSSFGRPIATCLHGRVYKGENIYDKPFATYDGNEAAAAASAAAFLLLLSNHDDSPTNPNTVNSTNESNVNILTTVLSLIGYMLLGIIKLIIYVFKLIFRPSRYRIYIMLSIVTVFVLIFCFLLAREQFGLGISLKNGTEGEYQVTNINDESISNDELKSTISVIKQRLKARGIVRYKVAQDGDRKLQVIVAEPVNKADLDEIMTRKYELTVSDEDGIVLLSDNDFLRSRTKVVLDGLGSPFIRVPMKEDKKLEEFSKSTLGKDISIKLDDLELADFKVEQIIIGTELTFTGFYSKEEAENIADKIRSLPLPERVSIKPE